VRTSFVHTEFDDEDVSEDADTNTDRFLLDSARLYVNGSVTKTIKFTFNTEYDGSGDVEIMDAVGQFVLSPKANIWVGRFLPPSDRANLYGPYYAHHWNVYQDGVQDGYPLIFQGRANGAMYWGQFDKLKLSIGVFDGPTLANIGGAGNFGGDDGDLLAAGRIHFDFWDAEDGYYLNSTYYGDKNLLAVGLAGQVQGQDHSAWSADFLLERKAGMNGAYTIEAEWARYSQLGSYLGGPYDANEGGFILGSYLFPGSGAGRWEVLGKYAQANFSGALPQETTKTTEINLNYIIKQFNARLMMFFLDKRFELSESSNFWKIGAGLQLQM